MATNDHGAQAPFKVSIAPWLSVRKSAQAVQFYKAAFGAVEVYHLDGPDDTVVARLSVDGSEFWVADESPAHGNFSPETLGGTAIRLILTVEDPDAAFARAVAAGAVEISPVSEGHGWRAGRLADPYGHHWEIGRPADRPARRRRVVKSRLKPQPHVFPGRLHGYRFAAKKLPCEVRILMQAAERKLLHSSAIAACQAEMRLGDESLWLTVRNKTGGGFALRCGYASGGIDAVEPQTADDAFVWSARTHFGEMTIRLAIPDAARPLLRVTTSITPTSDLTLPSWPRDLYPLGPEDTPIEAKGEVHAGQRGLCGGLVYLTIAEPAFGSVLYLQNLTALNEYFRVTGTIPDGVVGGRWPELGYLPPAGVDSALPANREITISDALLSWDATVAGDARETARLFIDLLANVYPFLGKPNSLYHDWPGRAAETLHDLQTAPELTMRHYGHTYLHPYTASEYPDSMVQLTVLTPMREWGRWLGNPIPFADELKSGIKQFYDPELGTIRRYLRNVGKDKNADEVDSWYLYHPLSNLGRLALEGDGPGRELFLSSLDYAIKVARHFKYNWPVQFDIHSLSVIKRFRKEGEPGQSDAGGLYAYVMLQAWDLTENKRYLDEARRALDAVGDRGFELEYQSNLCATGAVAAVRLWRITGDDFYRDVSYSFVANFFHNTILWEPDQGCVSHYPVFLGATCLHDGGYMALYECFESYAAFHEYLKWAGGDVRASVEMMLAEYIKYTASRAWFYYPCELPESALATDIRNGYIDRKLAIPLEDLYPMDRPAGQVGQEVYGSGAAFAFATRSYHRLDGGPFTIYCEYPILDLEEHTTGVRFRVRGAPNYQCRARLIPVNAGFSPDKIDVQAPGAREERIRTRRTDEGHLEFDVAGGSTVEITWA